MIAPTPSQRVAASAAARQLLEYALANRARFPALVGMAIRSVCRTSEGDPAAARAALTPLVQDAHLSAHGHEDLWVLADELVALAATFPDLTLALYENAFAQPDDSEEVTAIGQSRILGLRSTRRQDFAMGLHVLGERYRGFLKAARRQALGALDAAIESSTKRWKYSADDPRTFAIAGVSVELRSDGSRMFDAREHQVDDASTMLRALDAALDSLAAGDRSKERLAFVIDIAETARTAAVWRRVIGAGVRHPRTWGLVLWDLTTQPTLLMSWDTTDVVGRLACAMHPVVSPRRRRAIERALIALPESVAADDADRATAISNRILAALSIDDLVLDESRVRRAEIPGPVAIPGDEDDLRWSWDSESATPRGPDLGAVPNAAVEEARKAVRSTTDRDDTRPDADDEGRLVALERLHRTIEEAKADTSVLELGWAELADGCSTWLDRAAEPTASELDRVAVMVAEASRHRLPEAGDELDQQFADQPMWSPSDVRVTAAVAVAQLAREGRLLADLERLAKDASPKVRFQVLAHLGLAYESSPELAMDLAEEAAAAEINPGVILGLLRSLDYLVHKETQRASTIVLQVFDRFPGDSGASVRRRSSGLLAALSVVLNDQPATTRLDELVSEPEQSPTELEAIVSTLRSTLSLGEVPGLDRDAAIRSRAIRRYRAISQASHSRMRSIADSHGGLSPSEGWEKSDIEAWFKCAEIAAHVAQEVHFGSGAYDYKKVPRPAESNEDRLFRFYAEARELLQDLAAIGWPKATHSLIEALRTMIPADPVGVLELVADAVRSGKELGYESESLAVSQVVELVQHYLGEYRGLLMSQTRAVDLLLEILDGFARLGWEPALRLGYRLEEIYR